jgi:SPP1 gp7 family putative phage head morphogenesis protein
MPDPLVVVKMREFKEGLLLQEAAQMEEMARRWIQVEEALEAQITALAQDLSRLKAAGLSPTQGQLYRMERYRRLLLQAQQEVDRYAGYAEDLIARQQAIYAGLGVQHAAEAIDAAIYPRIAPYFDRLPVSAVEHMVGLAGNGAPLGELLRSRMVRDAAGFPLPGVWERLTEALIRGTALGWNPNKVARLMRDDLAEGLQKALTIARTEQLRVYREASRLQYRESGIISGYKRLTAHDDRVCAACLADEGHLYVLEDAMEDHPQGRCIAVPVVDWMAIAGVELEPIEWLRGEEWLLTQGEGVQLSILGRGHYDAWQAGAFEFGQLVTRTFDPVWGGGLRVTPLKELLATG